METANRQKQNGCTGEEHKSEYNPLFNSASQSAVGSLPCTPYFSRILPGIFTQQRSTLCFSSLQLLQAIGGCSLLPWPCLGSFLSDWGLGPLPLLYSLVCPISCLWTMLMGQLGLLYDENPSKKENRRWLFLDPSPALLQLPDRDFQQSYTRVLLRYLSQILAPDPKPTSVLHKCFILKYFPGVVPKMHWVLCA